MFAAGTEILASNGSPIRVEELRRGSRVLSFSSKRILPAVVDYLNQGGENTTITIGTEKGAKVTLTPKTMILTPGAERVKWVAACNLKLGSFILVYSAGSIVQDRISIIFDQSIDRVTCLDLHVQDKGCAFAGGVLCRA